MMSSTKHGSYQRIGDVSHNMKITSKKLRKLILEHIGNPYGYHYNQLIPKDNAPPEWQASIGSEFDDAYVRGGSFRSSVSSLQFVDDLAYALSNTLANDVVALRKFHQAGSYEIVDDCNSFSLEKRKDDFDHFLFLYGSVTSLPDFRYFFFKSYRDVYIVCEIKEDGDYLNQLAAELGWDVNAADSKPSLANYGFSEKRYAIPNVFAQGGVNLQGPGGVSINFTGRSARSPGTKPSAKLTGVTSCRGTPLNNVFLTVEEVKLYHEMYVDDEHRDVNNKPILRSLPKIRAAEIKILINEY